MKTLTRPFLFLLMACGAASCGGGSSSENVPNTQFLSVQLVLTGAEPAAAAPLPNQVTVISSAAQLELVRNGRFTVPSPLATYDFSQGDLIYVEGLGDLDPASVVRVAQVTRSSTGMESVTAEACSTGPRQAGTHRPFALYTVSKLLNVGAFSVTAGLFDCPTVRRLASTFVAAGSPSAFCCLPPRPPTFIRDQATLNALAALLPPGTLPVLYATPDFSQVTLVYLESTGEFDPQAYVRLMGAYENMDGSRDLVAERCDTVTDFIASYGSYAIYAIPRIATDARVFYVTNSPPGCLTTR